MTKFVIRELKKVHPTEMYTYSIHGNIIGYYMHIEDYSNVNFTLTVSKVSW